MINSSSKDRILNFLLQQNAQGRRVVLIRIHEQQDKPLLLEDALSLLTSQGNLNQSYGSQFLRFYNFSIPTQCLLIGRNTDLQEIQHFLKLKSSKKEFVLETNNPQKLANIIRGIDFPISTQFGLFEVQYGSNIILLDSDCFERCTKTFNKLDLTLKERLKEENIMFREGKTVIYEILMDFDVQEGYPEKMIDYCLSNTSVSNLMKDKTYKFEQPAILQNGVNNPQRLILIVDMIRYERVNYQFNKMLMYKANRQIDGITMNVTSRTWNKLKNKFRQMEPMSKNVTYFDRNMITVDAGLEFQFVKLGLSEKINSYSEFYRSYGQIQDQDIQIFQYAQQQVKPKNKTQFFQGIPFDESNEKNPKPQNNTPATNLFLAFNKKYQSPPSLVMMMPNITKKL